MMGIHSLKISTSPMHVTNTTGVQETTEGENSLCHLHIAGIEKLFLKKLIILL